MSSDGPCAEEPAAIPLECLYEIQCQARRHYMSCPYGESSKGLPLFGDAANPPIQPTVGGHFKKPTMVIGADVSHGAPGTTAASFAAMTVSMDQYGSRYAAAVETNGIRVEMIATKNIEEMLQPLIQNWAETVGQGRLPEHIYYFRDGVSEGQYHNVLKNEVADMKRLFKQIGVHNPNLDVFFLIVVHPLQTLLADISCRSNLPLWCARNAIISASSPREVLQRIDSGILCQAHWLKKMLPIRSSMTSICAPITPFKEPPDRPIITS